MILTEQSYHAPESSQKFMGASQFKAFQKCPAAALAAVRGEWERPTTTALLVGSYVDAHFSCTLDLFRAKNPAIFKRDGSLKAEFQQAEEIIARIERDPVFMEFMAGEKQTILTGEIAGVPFKAKPDVLHRERIVDLKIMRNFATVWQDGGRIPFVEAWGYDIQGAIYQEIVRQNTGHRLPFYIAAAAKETVPDIALFSVPQERLDYCLDIVTHLAPEFSEIKLGVREADRCETCDYCKLTKRLEGPVPYDTATLSA